MKRASEKSRRLKSAVPRSVGTLGGLTPWWVDLPAPDAPVFTDAQRAAMDAVERAYFRLNIEHTTLKRRYELMEHAILHWNTPTRVEALHMLKGPPADPDGGR